MAKTSDPDGRWDPDPVAKGERQVEASLEKAGLVEVEAWLPASQVPAVLKQMSLGGDYWHATRYPLGRAHAIESGTTAIVGPFTIQQPFLNLEIAADPETWAQGCLLVLSPDTVKGGEDAFGRRVLSAEQPFCEEPTTAFGISGCSGWQQIPLDVTAWKGGTAVLELRVKGNGAAYVKGFREVSEYGETAIDPGPPPPVWGFADLHSHPMAHIGFGGQLIAGQYDPGSTDPVDLGTCEGFHSRGIGDVVVNNWPDGHEAGGRDGAPGFGTWPTFKEGIHQQMHPAWVRRAWEGGLRLLVALVVNSQTLADERSHAEDSPHDDDGIIEPQIQFWRAVVDANSSWMAIATTSTEARQIINSGRLAVVFGLEVDAFLGRWLSELEVVGRDGFTPSRGANQPLQPSRRRSPEEIHELLKDRLRHLHDLGIRQLNPVHLADNAFGGSALYDDKFNYQNFHLGNGYYQPEAYPPRPDSPSGTDQIDFRLGEHPDALYDSFVSLARGYRPPGYGSIGPGSGHANSRGVNQSVAGPALTELMGLGFIIDVDHMSEHAASFVLDACAANNPQPYPVVSAHMSFRALSPRRNWHDRDNPGPGQRKSAHTWPHESEKSDRVATRILDIGGMLAPITSHRDSLHSGGPVDNDCAGSAKTYAQEFHHAVGMSAPYGRGVGIGTDMALNPQIGPRFGPLAAYGFVGEDAPNTPWERHSQAWSQHAGVVYRQPVSGRPRFYNPPQVDAHERLNPYVAPQDSAVDLAIGARYAFSIGVWRALWLHEAGRPADGENGDVQQMVMGFRTAFENVSALTGLARTACESFNGVPLDHLTDPGDLNDPRTNQRLVSDVVTIWRDRMRVGPNPPLERCVAGEYGFDFNVDGLAHYGLIPDLLQDLRNVGASEAMLESLFGSAESYLRVWERCEAISRAGSSATPVPRAKSGVTTTWP